MNEAMTENLSKITKTLNYLLLSMLVLSWVNLFELTRLVGVAIVFMTAGVVVCSILEPKEDDSPHHSFFICLGVLNTFIYVMIGYLIGTLIFNLFVMVI